MVKEELSMGNSIEDTTTNASGEIKRGGRIKNSVLVNRLVNAKKARSPQGEREWVVDRLVKNYRVNLAVHFLIIAIAIALIVVKLVFF